MRFYFNDDENICMTEDDLIEYLCEITEWEPEYIREELHTCREYYGWYECKVSNTIKEKFSKGLDKNDC